MDKYKNLINDFLSLMEYLNNIIKNKQDNDNNVKGSTKVYDVLKNINNNVSNEFLSIFDEKNKLKVNKIAEIFNYFLLLVFTDIKEEIKNYQKGMEFEHEKENQIDEKSIQQLNEYFQKKIFISKEDLEKAIRLFITLVLFREKDKENKIKLNRKNIVDYLKSPDLWSDEIYKNSKFNENLDELKLCNIQINNILFLYDYLIEKEKDIEEKAETKNY